MQPVPRISREIAQRKKQERKARQWRRLRRWTLAIMAVSAVMLQDASIHTVGFAAAIVFFLARLGDFRDEMDDLS